MANQINTPTYIPVYSPVYSGISFPPRRSPTQGFFYMTGDMELIQNSIYVILNTRKGSMPMNAEFGSSAWDLIFEPINDTTQSLIADLIQTDIQTWEPRVTVIAIKAASMNNTRIFEIHLQITATGQPMTATQNYLVG
jgi:phage baseplate assembly protein W